MKRVLVLGCGERFVKVGVGEEVVHHDLVRHRPEIDVTHDLNLLPWPWVDNSFDAIHARAVLEHLRLNLVESLNECWRLMRPGGTLRLKLPYYRHERSYDDPTHYWRYTLRSLDYFDSTTELGREYGFYTSRKWRIAVGPKLNDAGTSIHAVLEVVK